MSCNKKCYDHTFINTFAGICSIIDDVCNINENFIEKISSMNMMKSYFKIYDNMNASHMIKQILHSWSFHMKFDFPKACLVNLI